MIKINYNKLMLLSFFLKKITRSNRKKPFDDSVFEGVDGSWKFAKGDNQGGFSFYKRNPDLMPSHYLYWLSRIEVKNGYEITDRLLERK